VHLVGFCYKNVSRCTVLWMSKHNIHFWSYLARFFLEWETFLTKVVEEIKTNISCSITFSENRAVYEIMYKKTVQPDGPQMTTRRMRIACWTPEAINTHSGYVIVTFINSYCVSTATVVARKRLNVTLYVRTLPILLFFRGMHHVNRQEISSISTDYYGQQQW
jgi:hypothetical protein